MTIRLGVTDMIGAFGATYRAIDIRCAAVKRAEVWVNVYTVIRLTYEKPEFVERRLGQLSAVHGDVRTNSFCIALDQRSFSEWDNIRGEFTNNKLRVGDIEVAFQQPIEVDISRTQAYLQTDYSAIRPFDSCKWPVAQFCIHPYAIPAIADDPVVFEMARLGYSDPYDAVNLLCELNVQSNQSQGSQLYLSLPAFALISGFRILPREKRVYMEIKRHRKLKLVKGVILFRGRDHRNAEPWKHRLPIEHFSDEPTDHHIVTATGSVALPEVGQEDWGEAQILHPNLGQLHNDSSSVRHLTPPAQRNILFEALKFFCPEAELNVLTVRPFDKSGPKLKVSAGFELRVAWLLGLLGLSTIVLGEYEHIVAPNTGVRRGSVDVLAASQREKKLILVACTIGPPKDEDFGNIVTSAQILDREVFADATVRILPLVCTCAPGYQAESANGVPVLDADRLSLALRLVKAGSERDVLSFMENPSFNELKDPVRTGL
jgi:hypothetical protein